MQPQIELREGNDPGASVQIPRVSFNSNSHGSKANWTRSDGKVSDFKKETPKRQCVMMRMDYMLKMYIDTILLGSVGNTTGRDKLYTP